MTTLAQRADLHSLMSMLVAHEPQVHYLERRPMQTVHLTRAGLVGLLGRGGTITMDCSEAVTCLCKWAGLKDPNGLGYDGQGFTGTLLNHLPHYFEPSAANIGALVVFGPGTGEHVAMVYDQLGHNPRLWSHGSERGPLLIRLEDEAQYHSPPVTLLSIATL